MRKKIEISKKKMGRKNFRRDKIKTKKAKKIEIVKKEIGKRNF